MAETTNLVSQIVEDLDPGCMVLKFVLIAEVLGTDGQRGIWSATDDEASRWDTYGLLMEGLSAEQAKQVADKVRDEAGE